MLCLSPPSKPQIFPNWLWKASNRLFCAGACSRVTGCLPKPNCAKALVETHQGEGTYISEKIPENSLNPLVFQLLIDYGNHADILELRRIFEPAYTKLAMENATEEDVQRLCLACERFESKISQGCQEAEDDLAFHYAILEATKNSFVIRIGKTILQLFQASIGESMRTIPLQALSDHRRILQAFIKKDEQELICAVENSFQGWASVMAKEDCGPGHKKEDESI